MEKRETTKDECEYFDELEDNAEKDLYTDQHNGSFEASRGDYEGACLARAEFEAGYMS